MSLAIRPDFTPRVQPQLDGSRTGSHDCGRKTCKWLVIRNTFGLVRPKDSVEICERMGIPKCEGPNGKVKGTSIQEVKRGYDGYIDDAARLRLALPKMRIRSTATNSIVRPVSELMTALENGGAAALFVQYGVIDEAGYGGQPGLDVLHVIPIAGMRTDARGRRWTTSYDPLYDGRRKGIPNGPVEIPWNVIRRALGTTKDTTMGFGIFGTTARATVVATPPVPVPPVPVPPAPTVEELEAALERARTAEAERDRAQVQLGLIAELGAEIEWSRLVDLANAGLPEPNTGNADAPVEEGGSPPEED